MVRDRTVEPAQRPPARSSTACWPPSSPFPASCLLTIGAFRGLVLIEQGYTWAAWVTLGGIFVIAGAFCWTKRNP